MFSPTDGGDEPRQLSPGMQYQQRQSQRRFSMEVRVPLQSHRHGRVAPPITGDSNQSRLLRELSETICQRLEYSWLDSLSVALTHISVAKYRKNVLTKLHCEGMRFVLDSPAFVAQRGDETS